MRKSLRIFCKPVENIVIDIMAVNFVDFKSIDARIKHDDEDWMTMYPMGTEITVPEGCAKEIIEKLKLNPSVTRINGKLTARGVKVDEEMRYMLNNNMQRPPR